jgi:hypothetical protein
LGDHPKNSNALNVKVYVNIIIAIWKRIFGQLIQLGMIHSISHNLFKLNQFDLQQENLQFCWIVGSLGFTILTGRGVIAEQETTFTDDNFKIGRMWNKNASFVDVQARFSLLLLGPSDNPKLARERILTSS